MNVKSNIGILNALVRITAGLTLLVCCTARLAKKPGKNSYLIIAMLGAMKVAEGIVRFCPLTALFNNCQEMIKVREQSEDNELQLDEVPHNPT